LKQNTTVKRLPRFGKAAVATVALLVAIFATDAASALEHGAALSTSGSLLRSLPSLGNIRPPFGYVEPFHLAGVQAPFFLVFPIGVSGLRSFRSSTRAEPPVALFRNAESLCLGERCWHAPSDDDDGKTAGEKGSTRAITGIPIGAAALKLFASPVPKAHDLIAMKVAPMFALGGGGLEVRCAWW
jgi:hypothetical protein